ncbi:MAG TPA: helix-turn-helix transcriptional regulator [Nitrospira sp.]|nr:helix-turn-helix transcriptional regulator [Nitrospira sp.]
MTARGASRTAEHLLGEEISKLRRNHGISQEELGFQAGVHRTYVSQIERGLKSPTLTVILKLTHALCCSAGELVSEVEKRLKK